MIFGNTQKRGPFFLPHDLVRRKYVRERKRTTAGVLGKLPVHCKTHLSQLCSFGDLHPPVNIRWKNGTMNEFRCISHIKWKKHPPNHLCFQGKQGSLYYQPKQCIVIREIPQNCHRFVLFDSLKMGDLMTTGKFHNFSPFQRTRRDRLRTCHFKWG